MRRIGITLLSILIWITLFVVLDRFASPEGILVGALALMASAWAIMKLARFWRRRQIRRVPDTAETIHFHAGFKDIDSAQALLEASGWLPEADRSEAGLTRFRRSPHGRSSRELLRTLDDAGLLPAFKFHPKV